MKRKTQPVPCLALILPQSRSLTSWKPLKKITLRWARTRSRRSILSLFLISKSKSKSVKALAARILASTSARRATAKQKLKATLRLFIALSLASLPTLASQRCGSS